MGPGQTHPTLHICWTAAAVVVGSIHRWLRHLTKRPTLPDVLCWPQAHTRTICHIANGSICKGSSFAHRRTTRPNEWDSRDAYEFNCFSRVTAGGEWVGAVNHDPLRVCTPRTFPINLSNYFVSFPSTKTTTSMMATTPTPLVSVQGNKLLSFGIDFSTPRSPASNWNSIMTNGINLLIRFLHGHPHTSKSKVVHIYKGRQWPQQALRTFQRRWAEKVLLAITST